MASGLCSPKGTRVLGIAGSVGAHVLAVLASQCFARERCLPLHLTRQLLGRQAPNHRGSVRVMWSRAQNVAPSLTEMPDHGHSVKRLVAQAHHEDMMMMRGSTTFAW